MAAAATEKCANQGCSNPLDTTGYPKWCKVCRAAYKREERTLMEHRLKGRGFAAGVKEMREYLAAQFERMGSGAFTGYEIAEMIRRAPGPALNESD